MGEPRPSQALVMKQDIAGIAGTEEAISLGEIKPFHLTDNIERPGIGLQAAVLIELHGLQIPAICLFLIGNLTEFDDTIFKHVNDGNCTIVRRIQ
jgi:hypothetical protein